MKKKISMIVPFDVMKANIKTREHWVRTDWKCNDRYVTIADDRYCTPILLLVYANTDEYVIFRPTYNDFKYRWKKING